ncbi:MAG: hypothetical protein Tsb0020_09170 [Haliangiales bacterium]
MSCTEALRIILTIAMDRSSAASCLHLADDEQVSLWPSRLYQQLAAEASRSPDTWRRCAQHVNRSLGRRQRQFTHQQPIELARVFAAGRDSLSGVDLAALLWALLQQRSPMGDLFAGRLGAELETIAERRLGTSDDAVA